MTPSHTPPLFDAHLDLAYLAELGRDMHTSTDDCRGKLLPAALTLPSMKDGNVTHCLATIFTEGIDPANQEAEAGPYTYPFGDALAAWKAGQRQLKLYHAWHQAGLLNFIPHAAHSLEQHPDAPLNLGILIECADPVESPEQLEEWAAQGVVAVGMAWWHQGRYAAGNGTDPDNQDAGLTPLAKDLVAEIDRLGLTHDLSHLSQRAVDQLLELTDRPVIASHSNCRELLDSTANKQWQRHLSDDTIKEIASRGGVIGLNLVKNFIQAGLKKKDRPSIDQTLAHVERICELTGSTKHVGLGTDMDGGITANDLPDQINHPADLHRLTQALEAKGWSEDQLNDFRFNNWARWFGIQEH